MATLAMYQVDAFTNVPFGGNPAAVVLVPPSTKLDDAVRQQIAMEMNLAETAFLEPLTDSGEPCTASETPLFRSASRYRIRWFTPLQESELCGHATLASAAALVQGALGSNAACSGSDAAVGHSQTALADSRVEADAVGHNMWNVQCVQCDSMQRSYMHARHHARAGEGHPADEPLLFDTVYSGQLSVQRLSREAQPLLQLGMPWRAPVDQPPAGITAESAVIQELVGGAPVAELAFNSELRYLLVVLASDTRKALERLQPDMGKLKAAAPPPETLLGYIVTTVTEDDEAHDIAVRFWLPALLDWEDSVTGSSFAVAGPYWAKRLGKPVLAARQCSARGGELECHVDEQSQCVKVTGRCALAISGKLHLP